MGEANGDSEDLVGLVGDLAQEGLTLRAIRKEAAERDVELPERDEPLVRIMIESLSEQETQDEQILGSS